jgi:pyruvate/2-oxoglutarate dehydrogenase complex dihydrolipoamide dehydrogenase (E3) component
MAMTSIRTPTFFFVSQVGMLVGTIVYVNAGTQLSKLDSLSGILSPELILSFALLGVVPLVAKRALGWYKARGRARRFKRPRKFDYNLIAIGGGSAGLVTAYIAAAVKARVALIEKHKMGGDCLNTGCVPSKALIRSAKMLSYAARAQEFGFRGAKVDFEFGEVMERVQRVIRKIEPHDSVERYRGLGVDCIQGEARILSPCEVEVGGRVLTTRSIVVATGARAAMPPIPGLDRMSPLTSDTIWEIRERPARLLVLGGGPIGCELAQAFQRLGCQVTLVGMAERLLGREDDAVSDLIGEKFRKEGIRVLTGHRAKSFSDEGGARTLLAESAGRETRIEFDQVLVALGRAANTRGFGLEELGIELAKNGTIVADELLRTNYPNIYVCGDVTGPYQFTHVAAHQAWYCAVNALFAPFKTFKVDYRVIPWATYTDPEVGRVGLNEKDARARGIAYEVTTYDVGDLDRAIADEEDHGFVKVLTVPGKDTILGATIVSAHAGDLIPEFVTAMKHGLGLNKILGTIHAYPSLAEMNKYAAGNWKRSHAPESLLGYVRRFHEWRRG